MNSSTMPNKEPTRCQTGDTKPTTMVIQTSAVVKATTNPTKVTTNKTSVKEHVMSPNAAAPTTVDRTELLGSVTTDQQQRTSARVIKKLRLEPQVDREKNIKREGFGQDIPDCETPSKTEDKELKFPTKQRMPKALWSADEKSLFFEALNEYGKDFDAITAYICAKMKKKGMPDVNLKTKTQVSHFYYRTWHKLSKHVHFAENVKKVAQELYALINYGEMRKKLVSVNEKTCARLGDMVMMGSIMVRARGRNVRVRTPMCRALRRLNQITERACGSGVCSRAQVWLRARDMSAWTRVQSAAQNPRAVVTTPLRTRLAALIQSLADRWRGEFSKKYRNTESSAEDDVGMDSGRPNSADDDDNDDDGLQLETDRMILQEQRLPKKLSLHVGPRKGVSIHLPVISPSEQLSSQKICFSSYLERINTQRDKGSAAAKNRTPKRQRKDSVTDKDKDDAKKFKAEDTETTKLMHIDETAIDGIELMANYKHNQEDDEKPSTEDEKETKEEIAEEEVEIDRDKYMSEREKDSFSEMEDDDKYNKSDTDNESDHGKKQKFKNLKVKFRIRPKQRGGSIYTLVIEKDQEDKIDDVKVDEPKSEDLKSDEVKSDEIKSDDLKSDDPKIDETKAEEEKPDFDVDMSIKQIRKGWSVTDAGDLTIGDLYLLFGSRSKLELEYWWAEATPPLEKRDRPERNEKTEKEKKQDKTPDKDRDRERGTDSSVEEERDCEIMSPRIAFSQDSNDGMSGDERKGEQLASPEHKSSSVCNSTLKLVNKLINRPVPQNNNTGFVLLSDRLKRLLALMGNPNVSAGPTASCSCGHVCSQQRRQQFQKPQNCVQCGPQSPAIVGIQSAIEQNNLFRHPTPIAPRPGSENERSPSTVNLAGLPRRRRGSRGRQRLPERRVVVQRLLPLLPKLPPPCNLIPVKILPNTPPTPPGPPKILPKPPPSTTASTRSFIYVMSDSKDTIYYKNGDQMMTPESTTQVSQEESVEDEETDEKDNKIDVTSTEVQFQKKDADAKDDKTSETATTSNKDIPTDFLPAESLSLSPSRLLREAEGWLDGSVHDFSLSSFLGHLEGNKTDQASWHTPVESQLQSLITESSVDYVAKFADLAAEVTDITDPSDRLD